MAKFDVSQRVKVVDVDSSHNGQIGTVTVIAPKKDAVFYWLMFGPPPSGGRFQDYKILTTFHSANQPFANFNRTEPAPYAT